MPERIRRIELEVLIPGPKSLCHPLEAVEITFLDRKYQGVAREIEEARLWQNN